MRSFALGEAGEAPEGPPPRSSRRSMIRVMTPTAASPTFSSSMPRRRVMSSIHRARSGRSSSGKPIIRSATCWGKGMAKARHSSMSPSGGNWATSSLASVRHSSSWARTAWGVNDGLMIRRYFWCSGGSVSIGRSLVGMGGVPVPSREENVAGSQAASMMSA